MSNAFIRGLRRLFGVKPKMKTMPQVVEISSSPIKGEKVEPFNMETISAQEGEVKKPVKKKSASKKKPVKKKATKKKVAKKVSKKKTVSKKK